MSESDESRAPHRDIPVALQAPPSPDYILARDANRSPPLPYLSRAVYPEYMPQETRCFAPVPIPVWSDAEVARLLAISTPPSLPLSSWSSPLPQIPSPPLPLIPSPSLPVSPPLPVSSPVHVLSPSPPASPIRLLGYLAAMIQLRAEAASTSHSLPLPPPIILSHTRPAAPLSGTPPLHLLSTDRREDRPEITLLPRKRLGIALGPAYEVGESSSAAAASPARGLRVDYGFIATMDREIRRGLERDVGYGITDSWDEIVETLQGAPVSTDTELGRHMTAFKTRVRQDTGIGVHMHILLDSWRLRLGCLERLGDDLWMREIDGDYRDTGGRSQEAEAAHRGIEVDKETSDSDDRVREIAGTRQRSCTARATGGGW
ncbi:hypothetical protein Tco_0537028 [Tanacetum coccineum]